MPTTPTLRKFLSRWTYHTVPDYYWEAWRVLFWDARYKNREEILKQAKEDMVEELQTRRFVSFDSNRRQLAPDDYFPWFWGTKWR